MNPLQAVYALGLTMKNRGHAAGLLRPRTLTQPVLSIGNLSVGGAGKTPFVLALARLLAEQGIEIDVLSRGYGRRSPGFSRKKVERVDPLGPATRFGDEPLLLARTGLPVYVGANRYAAGCLAERERPGAVHLLDDGFQHRGLARAADSVLLHPSDLDAGLLPTGRLREPPAALGRAHFLVLRDTDTRSEPALRRMGLRQPIWRVRRTLAVPALPGPAVAFCAIAHPEEFFAVLRAQGIALAHMAAFRDHHRFRDRELATLAASACGASALLTTEKDYVRLTQADRNLLARAAPLRPVPLRAELLDAEVALAQLQPYVMRK